MKRFFFFGTTFFMIYPDFVFYFISCFSPSYSREQLPTSFCLSVLEVMMFFFFFLTFCLLPLLYSNNSRHIIENFLTLMSKHFPMYTSFLGNSLQLSLPSVFSYVCFLLQIDHHIDIYCDFLIHSSRMEMDSGGAHQEI